MKKLFLISYWVAAIFMVAGVLTSLDYKFFEALFIGTTFLAGVLAFKYFFPKAVSGDKSTAVKNTVFLILGIVVGQIFIVLLAHMLINSLREDVQYLYECPELPEILMNPIFIAIMTVIITVGYHFTELWLDKKYPEDTGYITFLSDRRPVTLKTEEILYIESNDSITTVYATDDRHFKNKTPISHWEGNLGSQFIRIHRSYLVNKTVITKIDHDIVYVGDTELPVSRKYRNISGLKDCFGKNYI